MWIFSQDEILYCTTIMAMCACSVLAYNIYIYYILLFLRNKEMI